jgi:hypothetical protein
MVTTTSSNDNAPVSSMLFTAHDYACHWQHNRLAYLIRQRSKCRPFEERYVRVLQSNDIRRCETLLHQLRNEIRQQSCAQRGIFYAAQFGSVRLLDYFMTRWKIDVNLRHSIDDKYFTTPLLTAITYNRIEAGKFLLFRHADPNLKGQFDNSLVTALHYQSSNDLIRLLLDKNVDITARHPDHKRLSLREFCIVMNHVKAKAELDAYILRLINAGNYTRLKWLVDHGYRHINVYISRGRNGRDLAEERYHTKIVALIDEIDVTQRREQKKVNY